METITIINNLLAALPNALWAGFLNYWFEGVLVGLVFWRTRSSQRAQARKEWEDKSFSDMVLFSLSTISGGKLEIDTLLEDRLTTVFHNSHAVEVVVGYAGQTTAENPLLPLPDSLDTWVMLNACLNVISEAFAIGAIHKNMRLPVETRWYWLCLTSEWDAPEHTRKVRVLLVQVDDLENLPAEPPQVAEASHITRWETLKVMREALQTHPHLFTKVRVSVPLAA